ncbi:MAG: ABC transporter ATP-binding protein [Nitrospiraceae bacterium]
MDAIVVHELRKTFKPSWPGRPPVQALCGLSLSVQRGEIYGFLGPNGSGKTTTLKILLGLMGATGGSAEVLGEPVGDVRTRRKVGFLPEAPYFYDYLTAEEFLVFYGQLAGLSRGEINRRVVGLLETVGMTEARTRQLRTFSKGMLQRVGLAQALIHDPELVILDEPMSGLDPIGRKQIRDVILSLRDQGKTVFFSSHIIPDVEMMCDRVGIIIKGQLQATGRIDELVSRGQTQSVEIVCEGLQVDKISAITQAATRVLQQGLRCLIVLPGSSAIESVLATIREHGGRLVSVIPQKGSLEDLFLQRKAQQD